MNVTFVLPGVGLSGGFRVIAEYARRLQRRGHRVVLVSRGRRQETVKSRVKSAVRELAQGRWPQRATDETGMGHFADPELEVRIVDGFRALGDGDLPDADVVVATWWETAEWVGALSRSKGAKAYFIQGFEIWEGQPEERVRATWRLPLRKIVVSRWLAGIAREQFGDDTAIVVHNAVDTTMFAAPARGKQERPTVGFIYSEVAIKGCDSAIRALIALRDRVPGLRVLAFGMEDVSPALPLPEWVDFVKRPSQEEIVRRYASCDAWLFSSRSEGYGLPIVEAMACRTPVVGTTAGAAPELIGEGGGVLVAVDDVDGMVRGLERVLNLDDAAWRAMSDRAFATAQARNWEESTSRFERALIDETNRRARDLTGSGVGGASAC